MEQIFLTCRSALPVLFLVSGKHWGQAIIPNVILKHQFPILSAFDNPNVPERLIYWLPHWMELSHMTEHSFALLGWK
jgi:hypothetical protein